MVENKEDLGVSASLTEPAPTVEPASPSQAKPLVSNADAYAGKLAGMTDDAFVREVEMQVWLSAFANGNPRAPAHKKCDAAYDEAKRRGAPWLYQRGWNQAYQSCGYEPTEGELEAARQPAAPEGETPND